MIKNRLLPFLILFLITLAPAYSADYYWVGGSGDWSDINHWAKSSGGSVNHLQVPTGSDNVIFDANSFSSPGQTVNMNTHTIAVNDFIVDNADSIDFQGVCHTLNVYGSLKFQKKMNWDQNITLNFNSQNQGNIIDPAEHKFSNVNFKGDGGEWILEGKMDASKINLRRGTLNTNDRNVFVSDLNSISSNTRSLELGSSQISINYQFSIEGPNISVSPGTSEIFILNGTPPQDEFKIHNTPDLSFYDVTLKASAANISTVSNLISFHDIEYYADGGLSGNHNIHDLILHTGIKLSVAEGYTKTFSGAIKPNGNCVKNTSIFCPSGSTIFSKNSGSINVEYVKLKNIHATGGATFNAHNSKDLGNNPGWNFTTPTPRTLYWVNSEGVWHDTTNWSLSSGGPGGECPPTEFDNVIIDQNSGSCDTIEYGALNDTIAQCHDLTWHKNTACPMTMIGDYHLEIHGSLDLDNYVNLESKKVFFRSSDMGETIKTGNVTFKGNVIFNGDGGWSLQDSLKRKNNPAKEAKISFIKGNLNTNGQYITTPRFWSKDTNTRVLTLGNSTIDVWQDSSWIVKQDPLTVNPGSSQINLWDSTANMTNWLIGAVNYHNVNFRHPNGEAKIANDAYTKFNKVTFNGNAFIKGMGEFDSLMLSQDRVYEFQGGYSQRINDYLDAEGGCKGWITMKTRLIHDTAEIFSSSGSISVDNVMMMRIAADGGANFYANNSADKGGNSGWNFTAPTGKDHYWVGGSGKWSDTTHWSYNSGGAGGACLPTPFDDVYFDSNSFNSSEDSVTIDCFNAFSKDMDWSNATLNPSLKGKENKRLRIFGSLTLNDSSAMELNYKGKTFFSSTDTGNTIHSGKNIFKNDVIFEGVYGGWSLSDTLFNHDSTKVSFLVGHLNLNSKGLITGKFRSDYSRSKTLDLSSSYMEIKAGGKNPAYSMNCDSLTLIHTNSLIEMSGHNGYFFNSGLASTHYDKILFSNTDSVYKNRKGKIQTSNPNIKYNKVTFLNNGLLFGPNKYDTLVFSPSRTYRLEENETQTIINKWDLNTDCNNYINIRSDNDGTQANVLKINNDVDGNFLQLKDINAIGSVNFNAYQSYDQGNNNGWNITPTTGLQLYWVNGKGDWFDPQHWSYSSGGPGGACIPTKKDDVYFDNNSFSNDSSKTVTDTNGIAYPLLPATPECRDIDWTGVNFTPLFDVTRINIHGSLTFIDSMKSNLQNVYFRSDTTGETITTAGDTFSNVYFQNGGGWTLMDSLRIDNNIYFEEGNLNTNGQTVLCNIFKSWYNNTRTLTMDTSDIFVGRNWQIKGQNFTLNSGQSSIYLKDTATTLPLEMNLRNGGKQQYHNVYFKQPGGASYLKQKQAQGAFNKLVFESNATIKGKSLSDTLIFRPGYTYSLDHNATQRIYDHWQVRGNNCFYINLESTTTNQQAKVKKNGSDVLGDFINMQDIKALGTSTFYAGDFSDDISNNDNWIFQNGPNYVYGLPDTTFFQLGGSATLSTTNFNGTPSTQYQWSTGSTADSIVVDSTAWYYVTVTYAGNCVVEDSTFLACDLNLDFKTKAPTCHGGSDGYAQVLIPDSSATYDYSWETGETSNYIDNKTSGKYGIKVIANDLCGVHDTAKIPETPPIDIPLNDTTYCEGDTIRLDASPGFKEYLWGDSLTKQYRMVSSPDTFTVAVQNFKGCWSDFDTIVVSEDSMPQLYLGPDTTLCLHETKELQALNGCDKYLWNTGDITSKITAKKVGDYWVKVWRGACTATDTITFSHCDPNFEIPNVFTPNGDGYNDRFIPETENITDFEMVIYNRWGNEIFRTRDMRKGWDGKINGQKASEGAYFYVIHYRLYGGPRHGEKKSISGDVTLLR